MAAAEQRWLLEEDAVLEGGGQPRAESAGAEQDIHGEDAELEVPGTRRRCVILFVVVAVHIAFVAMLLRCFDPLDVAFGPKNFDHDVAIDEEYSLLLSLGSHGGGGSIYAASFTCALRDSLVLRCKPPLWATYATLVVSAVITLAWFAPQVPKPGESLVEFRARKGRPSLTSKASVAAIIVLSLFGLLATLRNAWKLFVGGFGMGCGGDEHVPMTPFTVASGLLAIMTCDGNVKTLLTQTALMEAYTTSLNAQSDESVSNPAEIVSESAADQQGVPATAAAQGQVTAQEEPQEGACRSPGRGEPTTQTRQDPLRSTPEAPGVLGRPLFAAKLLCSRWRGDEPPLADQVGQITKGAAWTVWVRLLEATYGWFVSALLLVTCSGVLLAFCCAALPPFNEFLHCNPFSALCYDLHFSSSSPHRGVSLLSRYYDMRSVLTFLSVWVLSALAATRLAYMARFVIRHQFIFKLVTAAPPVVAYLVLLVQSARLHEWLLCGALALAPVLTAGAWMLYSKGWIDLPCFSRTRAEANTEGLGDPAGQGEAAVLGARDPRADESAAVVEPSIYVVRAWAGRGRLVPHEAVAPEDVATQRVRRVVQATQPGDCLLNCLQAACILVFLVLFATAFVALYTMVGMSLRPIELVVQWHLTCLVLTDCGYEVFGDASRREQACAFMILACLGIHVAALAAVLLTSGVFTLFPAPVCQHVAVHANCLYSIWRSLCPRRSSYCATGASLWTSTDPLRPCIADVYRTLRDGMYARDALYEDSWIEETGASRRVWNSYFFWSIGVVFFLQTAGLAACRMLAGPDGDGLLLSVHTTFHDRSAEEFSHATATLVRNTAEMAGEYMFQNFFQWLYLIALTY